MAQDKEAVRTQGERVEKEAVRERIPFGVPKSKLTVNITIPGYHLHYINDTPGRIFQAQQGGYEFVKPEEVGAEDTGNGKVVITAAGKNDDGSAFNAYLMKIKQDWYDEDQKQIQAVQDQFDDAIRRGSLNENSSDRRYVPKGGISIRN